MEINFYNRNVQAISFISFCAYTFVLISRPNWYFGLYAIHFLLMILLSFYFLIKKNKPISSVYARAVMILICLGFAGLILELMSASALSGVPIN